MNQSFIYNYDERLPSEG